MLTDSTVESRGTARFTLEPILMRLAVTALGHALPATVFSSSRSHRDDSSRNNWNAE
jgi:hypothetical protein